MFEAPINLRSDLKTLNPKLAETNSLWDGPFGIYKSTPVI